MGFDTNFILQYHRSVLTVTREAGPYHACASRLCTILILSILCEYHHSHILLKTKLFQLDFCRRHYGSIFNHFDIIPIDFHKLMQNTRQSDCFASKI